MYKFLTWETVWLCISCTCLTPCFLVLGRCCPNCYCMDSCSVAWEKRKDYIKHNYWYVAFCSLTWNSNPLVFWVDSEIGWQRTWFLWCKILTRSKYFIYLFILKKERYNEIREIFKNPCKFFSLFALSSPLECMCVWYIYVFKFCDIFSYSIE